MKKLLFVFLIVALLIPACGGAQATATLEPSSTPEATDTPEPTNTPSPTATPTTGVLADTFFFGCAYLDSNSNGEIDPDDQSVEDALFVVTLREGIGFGDSTTARGCAMVVVPGGLSEESWPVTVRMEPPEETSYELVGPAEVVLEYPDGHADFLFANPPESR